MFPNDLSSEITHSYFSYSQEKKAEILSFTDALLNIAHPAYNQGDKFLEGVSTETFYKLFLIDNQEIAPHKYPIDTILASRHPQLSLSAEKMVDTVVFLAKDQQIALAKLINQYHIPLSQIQSEKSDQISETLATFRKTLFEKLTTHGAKGQIIEEPELIKIAQTLLSSELIANGFDSNESRILLDKVVQTHHHAKNSIAKFIDGARQTTLLAPALIQALNGHSDGLIHMVKLIAADTSINHVYLRLIIHPTFVDRFPKTATVLSKSAHSIASPVAKILVLASFFELSEQLADNPVDSPEYQQAKSLLVDNTIIFSSLFAEALGLELGPAGLLIDLGITIHQLMISTDYLKKHYHLQISLWEGIKFNLGFDSAIQEILNEREILRTTLLQINQYSESLKLNFSYALIKIPKVIETSHLPISEKLVPIKLLQEVKSKPCIAISTQKYGYYCYYNGGFFSIALLENDFYYKRQYQIKSYHQPFHVQFSLQNQVTRQENNIFVQSEKKCLEFFYPLSLPQRANYLLGECRRIITHIIWSSYCVIQQCSSKPILTAGWSISASTISAINSEGRDQMTSWVRIEGSLGGLLINKNIADKSNCHLNTLILFIPQYGDMQLSDGNFLANKTVYLLIQDSLLADVLVKPEKKITASKLIFENLSVTQAIHYLVGTNNHPSHIYDNSSSTDITFFPLARTTPQQIISLDSNHTLHIGDQGPSFYQLDRKREIKINGHQGYSLSGQFNFTASLVRLTHIVSNYEEKIIFYNQPLQTWQINSLQGAMRIINTNNTMAIDFLVDSLDAALSLTINPSHSFLITANYNLNYFLLTRPSIIDNNFHLTGNWRNKNSYSEYFTLPYLKKIYSTYGWPNNITKTIDFSLRLPHAGLHLTFSGPYEIQNKTYLTQFIFTQKQQPTCVLFGLEASQLMGRYLDSFKNILQQGFSVFLLHQENGLIESIEFNPTLNCVFHLGIQYRFHPQHGLIAITGARNNATAIENFSDLLPDVPIDLSNDSVVAYSQSGTISVNHRQLVNLGKEVKLLTKLGEQYVGLLPRADDNPLNPTQPQALPIVSHDKNASLLPSSWKDWLIPASLVGTITTAGLLFIFCHHSRQMQPHVARPIALVDMAVLTASFVQTSNALPWNIKKSQLVRPRVEKSNEIPLFTKKAPYDKKVIVSFFEQVPSQLLFLHWCIGYYKKMFTKTACASLTPLPTQELSLALAKTLLSLVNTFPFNNKTKKIIHRLLIHLHKISLSITSDDTTIFLETQTQLIDWQNFIKALTVFKKYFAAYLKNKDNKDLAQLKNLLKQLERLCLVIDTPLLDTLNLPQEKDSNPLINSLRTPLTTRQNVTLTNIMDPLPHTFTSHK